MILSRREFGKNITLTAIGVRLALVGEGLVLAGCNVWTDIKNWVPVGEASLNAIESVLTSNGFPIPPASAAIITLTETGFTDLVNAINIYQSTTPPPVGAEAKVQAALSAVVTSFRQFLASIDVPGNIFSVISGLAQVVLSTIAAFENELPAVPATSTGLATANLRVSIVGPAMQIGHTSVPIIPKKRSRRVFKKDFNDVLDAAVKAKVIVPKGAYHHISLVEHLTFEKL